MWDEEGGHPLASDIAAYQWDPELRRLVLRGTSTDRSGRSVIGNRCALRLSTLRLQISLLADNYHERKLPPLDSG